jgi:hypothetical protein
VTNSSQLEQIIDDVTVDCYSEDEAASAFATAVDEYLDGASIPARLAGFDTHLVGAWLRRSATMAADARSRSTT